jgi:hypothetical protein
VDAVDDPVGIRLGRPVEQGPCHEQDDEDQEAGGDEGHDALGAIRVHALLIGTTGPDLKGFAMIVLRPSWHHLVQLVGYAHGRYDLDDETTTHILWEYTPFPMGAPEHVIAQLKEYFKAD